ncbi:MAG: PIG-L family deacetylase [Cyclobacteriaceae bacterium]
MKKIIKISVFLFVIALALIIVHLLYLNSLSKADSYPLDGFLQDQTNKKALIIVAHDDDAIAMSGTIAYLCQNGWDVRELCFYQGWEDKDSVRKRDLKNAAKLLGLTGITYHDIDLRKNRENIEKPWLPIPYDDFNSAYKTDTALYYIDNLIETFNPTVIFTLDDIMGGYGHPDHVLISKLIVDYCRKRLSESSFNVKAIYQAVFDPSMNEKILADMEAFQLAKELYQVQSSPKPDVYVSLDGYETIKKKAMLSYTTEQSSLTKIWPYYNYYPATIYFKIFDKEYYRVLKKDEKYR